MFSSQDSSVIYFPQVLTPHRIESIQGVWEYMTSPLLKAPALSLLQLALGVNQFDSSCKPFCLAAIQEALASNRPKYRHGAVLVKGNARVIATGRNKSIKEWETFQRIRHAEIDCLIQVCFDCVPIVLLVLMCDSWRW